MPNMPQNRLAAIAFRWSIAAVFVLCVFASRAPGQPAPLTAIDGEYNGSYTGAQGPTKLKLTLTSQPDGTLAGVFTLYLPEGSGTKTYICHLSGRNIPGRGFQLIHAKWETAAPSNLSFFGINGTFDPDGGQGAGKILGQLLPPGPSYEAVRDPAAAASRAGLIATKKAAAASTPASITGVYNGTYAFTKGPIKFKLTITQPEPGLLEGVFTLYLPEGSATKSYTGDLTGQILSNRRFALAPVRGASGPPNGVGVSEIGMNGLFDPAGGNGAGQISGLMRSYPSPKFEAIRDETESAKMAAAVAAKAPPAGPTAINGVYTGEFQRSNGNVKLKLSIKSTDDGSLTALFTFDPPADKKGSSVTYKLTGKYDAKAHAYGLASSPFEFTTIEPVGSGAQEPLTASKASAVHIGITGPGAIYGSMTGSNPGSGEFHVAWISGKLDRAESADLDKIMLAQGSGTTTAVPPAPPLVRQSFEGVYNGTYAGKQGPTKFKLTVWTQRENRTAGGQLVNTEVAGLLTLYLPDGSNSTAYTSMLKGVYTLSQYLQLTSGRWEPSPTGNFRMAGLQGRFDPVGGNEVRQISGYMSDATNSKFQAIRDVEESARMDPERLRNPVRPGFDGVFNGTYTRASGPPTKFKLTITHNRDGAAGLAGLATIYLPIDSGTKAYTYGLTGIETGHDQFQLRVNDWETMPPRDFQSFRSMGFKGAIVVDLVKNTARIASVPATGSDVSDFVPKFEATWDATESADVKGVIAAQKAVDAADYAAAMKARDQTVKTALPKQLASRDLVRKSRAYWDGYQTDMLREVFDGGFGAGIDDNELFEKLFCTYVEMYSAKYAALLPADHQTVTLTQKTNRKFDQNGNLISEDSRTFTVEMDSRFVAKYREFYASLTSRGAGMRGAAAAMMSGAGPRAMV
ncbi:MAG TPA: hypothetical protein VK797_27005, partial [Tepidisphaeraceae bacterium]|nr:hypothetical protein [Tepidisphaeraceae bacterium]